LPADWPFRRSDTNSLLCAPPDAQLQALAAAQIGGSVSVPLTFPVTQRDCRVT
jgi:hypothetical protein